ncbi:hypothetical protein SUGI_1171970 [Cryptomeria japonica]|uniref:protein DETOXIFICATION 56 n=1 Tax=Cryptomeria japonica TaxID=3369 RepID=UPI00241489CF|nr:protein DETOXIFICATION 56 [Cryptomeria japonica]GLJ54563.1 hypothetical protein SUGI_1171970 [Cryptomeria japonica]
MCARTIAQLTEIVQQTCCNFGKTWEMGAEDVEKAHGEEGSLLLQRSNTKEDLKQWPGWKQVLWELQNQKSIGLPIAAMNMMWFGRMVISTAFLGRQGKLELAGGALALTFANVTAFSVLTGLSAGMEPLCAQAFGAANYKLLGATLYRGIILLFLTSLPIGFLWLNVTKLLLELGQDKEISKVAGTYLMFLLPDLAATSVLVPLRIYLRSQCITKPMMVASAIALILHLPINMALQNLGVKGTALAIFWSDCNVVVMLLTYVYKTGLYKTTQAENWWRTGWAPLLKLSVASCLLTCLEWWCYEILMLITGRLPKAEEAVSELVVVLNGDQILYSLQIALAACASTRVGNELGGNNPVGAYHAAVVAVGLSVVVGCAGASAMIVGRNAWGMVFSTDQGVLGGVGKLMCFMAVAEIFNFPLTVAGGVLRGTARPTVGVFLSLGSFYLFGLPIGVFLAFQWKLRLVGLLMGFLIAVAVCSALTLAVVFRTDWIHHTVLAQELINGEQSELKSCQSGELETIGLAVMDDGNGKPEKK